jgi:hypothetical protein
LRQSVDCRSGADVIIGGLLEWLVELALGIEIVEHVGKQATFRECKRSGLAGALGDSDFLSGHFVPFNHSLLLVCVENCTDSGEVFCIQTCLQIVD